MFRNRNLELSGQRRVTGICRYLCCSNRNEQVILIKAEYTYLLYSATVRIDCPGLDHVHIRHLDIEAKGHITIRRSIPLRRKEVLPLAGNVQSQDSSKGYDGIDDSCFHMLYLL